MGSSNDMTWFFFVSSCFFAFGCIGLIVNHFVTAKNGIFSVPVLFILTMAGALNTAVALATGVDLFR